MRRVSAAQVIDEILLADLRRRLGAGADFSEDFPPFAALRQDWVDLKHDQRALRSRIAGALAAPLAPGAAEALIAAPALAGDEVRDLLQQLANVGRLIREAGVGAGGRP